MSRDRVAVAALGLLAFVLVSGCLPGGGPGDGGPAAVARPVPAAPGVPLGEPVVATIGEAGGTLASPDARLTLSVPAGAVSAPTAFSVQEITNTAPGGVGSAYRIEPHGLALAAPATLVFRLEPPPASLHGLAVATQERQGFWLRHRAVARDAAASTIAATVGHFSDWAVQTASTDRDLRGAFTIDSTIGLPFTATGETMLDFAGEDERAAYYLQSGTISAPLLVPSGASTCTPDVPTHELFTNVAELVSSPLAFNWGVSGHWPLTCSAPGGAPYPDFISTAFDTYGINLLGCARRYVGAPTLTATALQGVYTIDCGPQGSVTASFNLASCAAGTACTSSDPCRTATIACDTGLPVCTDDGNVPDGTSCGTNLVCGGGVCGACTAGEGCTSSNPCHTAAITCDTGAPVCTDSGDVPDGTSCGPDQVCAAGACSACVANADCTPAGACTVHQTSCATGTSVCVDTLVPRTDGTSCGPDQVCNGGTCGACVADADCTPAGACTAHRTSCATGTSVCVDTLVPLPAGTSCGPDLVCGGGVCNACTSGAGCAPDACHTGTISCTSGSPACVSTGTLPDGTTCGIGQVCNGGVCSACVANADCTPADACTVHQTSCASGTSVCVDTGVPRADGTTCGTDQVCTGGVCTAACVAGVECTPVGACTVHATECSTGTAVCADTTVPVVDGTECGTGLVCTGGVCQTP